MIDRDSAQHRLMQAASRLLLANQDIGTRNSPELAEFATATAELEQAARAYVAELDARRLA